MPPDRLWQGPHDGKFSRHRFMSAQVLRRETSASKFMCFFGFVYFSYGQDHSPRPKPRGGGPRCSGCGGEEKERCDPGRPPAFLGHLSANSGSWALLQPHGLQGQKGAEIQELLVARPRWDREAAPAWVQVLDKGQLCLLRLYWMFVLRVGKMEHTYTCPELKIPG